MSLLRRTDAEAERFRRLDRRLPVLSEAELSRLAGFRFLHQRGNVNSFLAFDVRAWAKAQGYASSEAAKQGNIRVYDVTRD